MKMKIEKWLNRKWSPNGLASTLRGLMFANPQIKKNLKKKFFLKMFIQFYSIFINFFLNNKIIIPFLA